MSTISSFPNTTPNSSRLADDTSGADRLERQLFVALLGGVLLLAAVSYTHLTLPTNREV